MKKIFAFFALFIFLINVSFAITKITNKDDYVATFAYDIPFSEKEIAQLKNLDKLTLQKLEQIVLQIYKQRIGEHVKSFGQGENANTNQKALMEKCAREKATTGVQTDPNCKKLDPKALDALVNLIKQDLLKRKEFQAEQEALSDGHKNTPEFNNLVRQAQQGRLPVYSDSVLNQTSLVGTPDFFDGNFVCNVNNNGSYAGTERPRNQGGRIANELFYGIANAAKASGAHVGSFGCFNNRNIAGTNTPSKHATGDACDVVLRGNDSRNTAFMVMFLANTGNHNTVGSYASRGFDHSHLGADCGGTWCPYQKGAGLEPWKELAFRTVFKACNQDFHPGARPSKVWVQNCAKKAVEAFCKQAGV